MSFGSLYHGGELLRYLLRQHNLVVQQPVSICQLLMLKQVNDVGCNTRLMYSVILVDQ
ncbi:hypothetical protein D3C75_1063840 [compost metagenome]